MKFILPLPKNRANARWHWRTEHRLKLEYWDQCLARYGKLPLATTKKMKATATLYVWNLMDEADNMGARLKWVWDWLQIRGYILNDSPTWLDVDVSQQVDRKNQRVEITLEPITEGGS